MANDSAKKLIQDTRRWVEQEKAWDSAVYATSQASPRTSSDPIFSPSPTRKGGEAKAATLQALYDKYNTCVRCPLGKSRLNFVFGVGNPDAEVLLIGEGPGYQEDHKG